MVLPKANQVLLKRGQRGSEVGDELGGFCSGTDGSWFRDKRNRWTQPIFWVEN